MPGAVGGLDGEIFALDGTLVLRTHGEAVLLAIASDGDVEHQEGGGSVGEIEVVKQFIIS